jgi:dTDP-4-dehydrorhamnose reductase
MRILVLGATGMLGQALMAEGQARGFDMQGAARGRTNYWFDISKENTLAVCLDECQPDLIINAAANTDLKFCEENPGLAYETNARPLSIMAEWAQQNQRQLIHISTDHFYTSGFLHWEEGPVQLVNEYARSKYLAERLALTYSSSLVIRTNIVGFRGHGTPTFAEWAMAAIENQSSITMFDDFFTSSIDVWSFSTALFDLIEKRPGSCGLLNIASRQVASKKEFIEALAIRMGKTFINACVGSVQSISPKRATNCGLSVMRIENLLSRPMPDLNDVVNALVERRNQPCINPLQSMVG